MKQSSTSGTYPSNDKSDCPLTIFERGKIRIVDFKKRITKNESIKYIFDPIKTEKWKSFEDTVKRIIQMKIDIKIKDIDEQKAFLGYLQQNQIKVNQLSTLKTLYPFYLPLFDYPLPQQMVQCEKQKNLIFVLQLIHSQITTYH